MPYVSGIGYVASERGKHGTASRVSYGRCSTCDRWFSQKSSVRSRRCQECQYAGNFRKDRNRRLVKLPKIACKCCGKSFAPRDTRAVMCSYRCRNKFSSQKRVAALGMRLNNYYRNERDQIIAELLKRDGDKCKVCGDPIDCELKWPDKKSVSTDHIVEFRDGGSHEIDNMQLCHLSCNSKKSNRLRNGRKQKQRTPQRSNETANV